MNKLFDRQSRGLSCDAQLAVRVIRDGYGDLGHGRDLLGLLKMLARVTGWDHRTRHHTLFASSRKVA
jgi:hypothetical protein